MDEVICTYEMRYKNVCMIDVRECVLCMIMYSMLHNLPTSIQCINVCMLV